MLQHEDIWRAVDRLAAKYNLSASGLARKAGLDPTTFNKSKRASKEGKQRWPSTESVAKILDATGASLDEFISLIGDSPYVSSARRIPVMTFGQASKEGQFDSSGAPIGGHWDEVLFPYLGKAQVFALEVTGQSMNPVYSDGDILVVSPNAGIRRGDRVVVKLHNGELLVMRLVRQSAAKVELAPIWGDGDARLIEIENVAWVSRVLWASQ
ncbi:MAG: helix-turn-helix transcriptional regulator [Pseudomonadota bacterium]